MEGNIMKKNILFLRRVGLAAICLSCALSLSACGNKKNVNENKDPLTGEDMTEDGSSEESSADAGSDDMAASGDYGEFDTMIGDENSDPNEIMDYINTNIVSAGVSDVEHFFTGLLGFGDDIREIDFTRLEESRQYMPEDMIAFMDLMKLEADTPSMVMSDEENRRVINMTLSEMLERALLFEQHLEKYPNNVTTEAASRLYNEIATNAISGGYNKTEGISHYYKGDTDDVVDQEALQYYQQFAEANADSNLGRLVQEYITVLQTNQFQINDAMEEFYMGLQARLNVDEWAVTLNGNNGTGNNGTNGTANGTTGANNNGTAGAGGGGNGTTGAGNSGTNSASNGTTGANNNKTNGASNGTTGANNNKTNGASNGTNSASNGTTGTNNNGINSASNGSTGANNNGTAGAGNNGTTGTNNNGTASAGNTGADTVIQGTVSQ